MPPINNLKGLPFNSEMFNTYFGVKTVFNAGQQTSYSFRYFIITTSLSLKDLFQDYTCPITTALSAMYSQSTLLKYCPTGLTK